MTDSESRKALDLEAVPTRVFKRASRCFFADFLRKPSLEDRYAFFSYLVEAFVYTLDMQTKEKQRLAAELNWFKQKKAHDAD